MTKRRFVIVIIVICLFSTILELFVFNFRFFESRGYQPIYLQNPIVDDGLIPTDQPGLYTTQNGPKTLEYEAINQPIYNIFYDVALVGLDETIPITLFVTDKGNALYFSLPQMVVMEAVEPSKYHRIHLSGETPKIKIDISVSANKQLEVRNIVLNARVPLFFSPWRFCTTVFVLLFLYMVRSKSPLHDIVLNISSLRQKTAISMCIVLHCVLLYVICNSNPQFVDLSPTWYNHYQYQELTESLLKGQFHLDDEVPQVYIDMENPYDTHLRKQVQEDSGERYRHDVAYYNEKYYVYFGVIPVLLVYLPYYVITGSHIPNHMAVYLFICLCVVAIYFLSYQIIKKKFHKCSLLHYLLLNALVINGSYLIYLTKRPDLYSIPISSGIAFCILSFGFWLMAMKDESLSTVPLLLGSVCMALVVGCRPPLFLSILVAVPLFSPYIFKKRKLFSRKSVLSTAALVLPFVVVAIFLMYYNHVRFGSPFDFGANYNLTSNDMRQRGIVLERNGIAFFSYYLQPPHLIGTFPFMKRVDFQSYYMGRSVVEYTYGGILACNPFLWILPFFMALRSQLKKRGLFYVTCILIGLGMVLGCLDAQLAGILQRYFSDFAFLLFFASYLLFLTVYYSTHSYKYRRCLNQYLVFGLLSSTTYQCMLIFASDNYSIFEGNPTLYYTVLYMIHFLQ